MLCSRCVLPCLALYLMLEEMSAAVLPSAFRNKRVGLYAQHPYLLLDKSDTWRHLNLMQHLSFYNLMFVLRKSAGRTKSCSPARLTAQSRETSLWATPGRWAGMRTASPLIQRLSPTWRSTCLCNARTRTRTRTRTSTSTAVRPMKRGEDTMRDTLYHSLNGFKCVWCSFRVTHSEINAEIKLYKMWLMPN